MKNDHPIWHKIDNDAYFYFVHSYFIDPEDESIVIGKTKYGDTFSSVVAKDQIIAIQGHLKKAHLLGYNF